MDPPVYRAACHASQHHETDAAIHEVLSQLAEGMKGTTDVAIVFMSGQHVRRADLVTSAIYDLLAPQTVIGCSSLSVVANEHEFEDGAGLVVLAMSLPGVEVFTFTDTDLDWPRSTHDPDKLTSALRADRADLRGVMLLADPFTPISTLLPALSDSVTRPQDRPSVPIFGGVASAGKQAGDNRLLRNDEIRNGGIVGIGFCGPLRIDTMVSQGCRPIGQPMVITSAKRNIIESLGGRPAMAAFQEMAVELPDEDRDLIQEKGLFVGRVVTEYRDQFSRGDFLIRNVIGVDRERGMLAVSDILRTGQTVQFHVRDAVAADEDLQWMLGAQALDDKPFAGLLFTCNGRGQRLFKERSHDSAAIRKSIPGLPLSGFAAAGEIGPVGHQTFLHGHTASIALFRGV